VFGVSYLDTFQPTLVMKSQSRSENLIVRPRWQSQVRFVEFMYAVRG
jgi:hypothetical protein